MLIRRLLGPAATTLLAAGLAGAYLLLTPALLSPVQLGALALGISFIQLFLQLGDLGFVNASASTRFSTAQRETFRRSGGLVSITLFTVLNFSLLAVCLTTGINRDYALIAAFALLSAQAMMPFKLLASSLIQHGRGPTLYWYSFIWQNFPRLGIVLGLVTKDVFWCLALSSVLCAIAAICVVRRFPVHGNFRIVWRDRRFAISGLAIVLSTFLMSWLDSYLLAAYSDVEALGRYQAIYRPLFAVSYIYLPFLLRLQNVLNTAPSKVKATVLMTACAITAGNMMAFGFLVVAGPAIWSTYKFPLDTVACLTLASTLSGASALVGTMLLVRGERKGIVVANLLAAAVIGIGAIALIPPLREDGAALSALASWATAASYQAVSLARAHRVRP